MRYTIAAATRGEWRGVAWRVKVGKEDTKKRGRVGRGGRKGWR
jgi:hypothetical protein